MAPLPSEHNNSTVIWSYAKVLYQFCNCINLEGSCVLGYVMVTGKSFLLLDCSSLKMKALWSSETVATVYQSTWPNVSEELNLQQHQCENIKSCTEWTLCSKKSNRKCLFAYHQTLNSAGSNSFVLDVSHMKFTATVSVACHNYVKG